MFRMTLCCTMSAILIFGPTAAQAGIKIRPVTSDRQMPTLTNRITSSATAVKLSSLTSNAQSTGRQLQASIDRSINTARIVLQATNQQAQTGVRLIGDARKKLRQGRDSLQDAREDVKDGARKLKTVSSVSKTLAKKLENKSGVLGKASSGLKTLSQKAAGGSKVLTRKADQLKSGIRKLASGSAKLKNRAQQLTKVSLGSQQAQHTLKAFGQKSASLLNGPRPAISKSMNTGGGKTLLSSARKQLTQAGAKTLRQLTGSKPTQQLLTKAISQGGRPKTSLASLVGGGSPKNGLKNSKLLKNGKLLRNSRLLKTGSKLAKGGVLGAIAEDVVGIDPFKVGRDVLTNPSNIVKSLSPKNIDRHLQKQAKNLHQNYLKFGHVKKGLDGLDRLTQGHLSKSAAGLDQATGGQLGKAGKAVGKAWNAGVDGIGKVATGGYQGVKKGVDKVADGVDKAGQAVGKGVKDAGKGIAKAGKSVGKFVGGLFGKKNYKRCQEPLLRE